MPIFIYCKYIIMLLQNIIFPL